MAYLLSLEPDRMMAYYRKRAGLEAKAPAYGGWDGDHRNLTGHIAGHYLSAVSLMYAATGDARLKERADYLVKEMKEVQDKNGDGYLSALEGGREKWAEVAAGNAADQEADVGHFVGDGAARPQAHLEVHPRQGVIAHPPFGVIWEM